GSRPDAGANRRVEKWRLTQRPLEFPDERFGESAHLVEHRVSLQKVLIDSPTRQPHNQQYRRTDKCEAEHDTIAVRLHPSRRGTMQGSCFESSVKMNVFFAHVEPDRSQVFLMGQGLSTCGDC